MAIKGKRVACGPRACAMLCEALRGYAAAAFPPGGSECAQASRESLLELANRFAAACATDGHIEFRARQGALLRNAVTTYFDQLAELPAALAAHRRDRLLALLGGATVTDAALDPEV